MDSNMDITDEVNDSDGELIPFFDAILDNFQEGKYKEDAIYENSPAVEDSEPLVYENRVIMIEKKI